MVESRPLVVEGHAAVDARIEGWSRQDGSGTGTLILRIIDTPAYEVTVEANSDTADAALAQGLRPGRCKPADPVKRRLRLSYPDRLILHTTFYSHRIEHMIAL